jgi:hypothetical protein
METLMLIVECKKPLFLTKQHSPDGTKSYDLAKWCKFEKVEIDSFETLCATLRSLESEPRKCIIRGDSEIKEGFSNTKQLLANGGQVVPEATRWLLFDFDGRGGKWAEWASEALSNPEGMVKRFLAEECPKELAEASVYWQYGSSIGVDKEKFSLHLWVYLSEPVLSPKAYYLQHGFDGSLDGACQPHYTATPIFTDMVDPMPVRSGVLVGGGDMDASPILNIQKTYSNSGDARMVGHKDARAMMEDYDSLKPDEAGARHPVVISWSLSAIANGMDSFEVESLVMSKLIEWDKEPAIAQRDAASMVKGAVAMVAAGRVVVDHTTNAEVAFDEDVADVVVEDAAGQTKELCGPSILDKIKEAPDAYQAFKDNLKDMGSMDEAQLLDLEDVLVDVGVIVDSKPKAGQMTRARLGKLVKASGGDGGSGISAEVVERYKETWSQTYCSEKNGAFCYFFYNKADKSLRLASKRDELDSMCSYITAEGKKAQALLFREEFYRTIHEERQIVEWVPVTKPFGEPMTRFEQRGDGKLNAIVEVSVIKHLELLKNRHDSVEVPERFETLMDKEYAVVWNVLKAVLARRFLGNKKSTIWVHCSSDWGKSFFFSITDFALTMDNGYSSENFKGDDPAELAKYIYLFIDEAEKFSKEMKLDTLSYRRLWGGQTSVKLPARIIASANSMTDLSGGVDKQLINRVTKIKVDGRKLDDVMSEQGWSTELAKKWYDAMVSRRMHEWLMEWGEADDFTVVTDEVYKAFLKKGVMDDVEDIEETLKGDFWDHFLWGHLVKVGNLYRLKTRSAGHTTAWASDEYLYMDNGSDKEPDRRRLYIKGVSAWSETYIKRTFGKKHYAILKAVPNIETLAQVLGGTRCTKLPNRVSFKGIYFDVAGLEGLEEVFGATKEG